MAGESGWYRFLNHISLLEIISAKVRSKIQELGKGNSNLNKKGRRHFHNAFLSSMFLLSHYCCLTLPEPLMLL